MDAGRPTRHGARLALRSRSRLSEKRLVIRIMLRLAVAPVGQKGEHKIQVRVRKVVNFKPFHLAADFRNARKHRRNDDDRSADPQECLSGIPARAGALPRPFA